MCATATGSRGLSVDVAHGARFQRHLDELIPAGSTPNTFFNFIKQKKPAPVPAVRGARGAETAVSA